MHAVFGVASVAMLVTTVWMLADDHNRQWKNYQRQFRDVETWTNKARIVEQETSDYNQTEADLKKVQKALRENSVVSDEIWSKRVQQAQEKLRSGDPLELAEIVRDGVRREQGKTTTGSPTKLSTSERALHLKARELLSGEIVVTRGVDQAEADAWIDEQLAAAK